MDDWVQWLREHLGWVLLAALLALTGAWWWQTRPVSRGPGVLAAEDPIQTDPPSPKSWTYRKHRITSLAGFEIQARVLSTERYRFDRASELSPVDFALGWGPMSDSKVLAAFSIQQRDRWFFWRASKLPIEEEAVITHSANMHMIPATEALGKRLLAVRPGEVVKLQGQLVRADSQDGWHWVSSLTRGDSGDGSCEVVWVERVSVVGQ
jgi:hypothetical protein